MSADAVSAAARAYAGDPGPRTLAVLRAAVLAVPGHDPGADAAGGTAALRAAGRHADVVATLEAMMPGAFLGPMAHGLLAEAHAALGNTAAAEDQQALTRMAYRTLLEDGDGSAERPWTVLRISDEYDVLRLLGRPSTGQALVERDGRRLDRHTHADGSQTWFDVTALPTGPAPTR